MAFGNFSSALACKRNLSCNITSHSTDMPIFAKNITTSIDFSFHRFVKFVRKTIIVQRSLRKSRKERVKRECGLYSLKQIYKHDKLAVSFAQESTVSQVYKVKTN